MENYTITKEKVLQLHKMNREGNDQLVKADLEKWFPEAFNKDLELNKWYVDTGFNNGRTLSFFDSLDDESCIKGYGFSGSRWYDDREDDTHYGSISHVDDWREATDDEVSAALIAEAKKRGYKEDVIIKGLASGNSRIIPDGKFEFLNHEVLWFGNPNEGYDIFRDGKWAEIIPQEKTVVPMEKALKILAKKLKVSPENIEIKN